MTTGVAVTIIGIAVATCLAMFKMYSKHMQDELDKKTDRSACHTAVDSINTKNTIRFAAVSTEIAHVKNISIETRDNVKKLTEEVRKINGKNSCS